MRASPGVVWFHVGNEARIVSPTASSRNGSALKLALPI
jgi:hypothetical protein